MKNKKKDKTQAKQLNKNNQNTFNISFHIEIRGRNNLTVRGCRKVLLYSADKISLKLKREILTIKGNSLKINTYFTGVVEVCGCVTELSFGGLA